MKKNPSIAVSVSIAATLLMALFASPAFAQSIFYTGPTSVGIGTTSPAVSLDLSQKTDAVALPVGTTGTRPTGSNGEIRYNSTNNFLEVYANGAWQSLLPGGVSSGGYVNKFRNGTMLVSQRIPANTSTSLTTTDAYWIDGWQYHITGAAVAGYWQNTAFTAAVGNNPAYLPGYMQIKGAAGNTGISIYQRIESYDVTPLAGQTVTVQFQFYNGSGASITPSFQTCYASAKDNFSTCTPDIAATNLQSCANATTCTEAYTFVASANAANGYQVQFNFGAITSPSNTINMSGFDIRSTPSGIAGINAAPPTTEIPTIASELARDQRYYFRIGGTSAYQLLVPSGICTTSTTAYVYLQMPSPMRAVPTFTSSTVGYLAILNANGNVVTVTSASLNPLSLSATGVGISIGVASGIVAGNQTPLVANNTTSAYIALSSEL